MAFLTRETGAFESRVHIGMASNQWLADGGSLLCPKEEAISAVLLVMAVCPQDVAYLLDLPLHLPICLRVECRGKTH